jgi:electron transfer flavoprotein alpha subunit
MAKGVWIVAEQRDGALRKVSYELASTARKLADQLGDEVGAVFAEDPVRRRWPPNLVNTVLTKFYVAKTPLWNHTRRMPIPSGRRGREGL